MISIFYLVQLAENSIQEPVAADDASAAAWYDLKEFLGKPDVFAFDHHEVLSEVNKAK